MKRFLTGDKAWKNKKLRLALVGALVVILVLVGALVWALTDDYAVKAASGAATPGTSGSSQAGPNQTGSNQAGSNQAGRSDASSESTSSTAGSQASGNNGKVNTWGSVCGLAGSELKPTSQVNMPTMRSKVFVDSTYYYYNNLTGPGKRADGDVPTCYAHTSEGAILAATNFQALGAGKHKLVDLVKATTYEDDNQKRQLTEGQNSDGNGTTVQTVGYSIQVIDENNVVVRLAIRIPKYPYALAQSTFTLIWDKGDWKVKIGPKGPLDITVISSVENAGMVPWAN